MTKFDLPFIEDIDVEDLPTLHEGYRYELHGGNLVIMTPATFWHRLIQRRIYDMLRAAGQNAFQDPGVLGDGPRDNRLPGVAVITELPAGKPTKSYSNLPGSFYFLVVEVVSENSPNGEHTDKMAWYAERGIPEYWIADESPSRPDDAMVQIHVLAAGSKATYAHERTILLSELEKEYQAKGA